SQSVKFSGMLRFRARSDSKDLPNPGSNWFIIAAPMKAEGHSEKREAAALGELLLHAPVALVLLTPENSQQEEVMRISAANPSAIKLLSALQLRPGEVIGKNFTELLARARGANLEGTSPAPSSAEENVPAGEICCLDIEGNKGLFALRTFP